MSSAKALIVPSLKIARDEAAYRRVAPMLPELTRQIIADAVTVEGARAVVLARLNAVRERGHYRNKMVRHQVEEIAARAACA